jgi:predicted NBD/HSP70 family sugar kinase
VSRLAGANQDEVRRHNLASLVRIVHERGASTRSELVEFTGLNRSTVGTLTTELAALGLVRESTGAAGGVGRPSIRVEACGDSTYVLAVDLRVDRTIVALVGLGGRVLSRREDRREIDLNQPSVSADRLIKRTVRLCKAVLAKAPVGAACVGVGVGVPGLVRQSDGLVRAAPNLGWIDVPLRDRLVQGLGLDVPVVVGNDSDLGALSEHLRGCARDASYVIYIAGQVGVGAGVILDGLPLLGAGGYGGEVGHTRVNPQGRWCHCGAQGCWETEVGEPALLAAAGHQSPGGTTDDVVKAAEAGDAVAQAALDRVGHWLGVGVANLVNLFNPEVVVFGGTLRSVFPMAEPAVREALSGALTPPLQQVRLALPGLGDDSTLLGADEAAFAPLLADPLLVQSRNATAATTGLRATPSTRSHPKQATAAAASGGRGSAAKQTRPTSTPVASSGTGHRIPGQRVSDPRTAAASQRNLG